MTTQTKISEDRATISSLAATYSENIKKRKQDSLREHWNKLHNLDEVPPLIYMRGGSCFNEVPACSLRTCSNATLQGVEATLRKALFHQSLEDDFVFEPWYDLAASKEVPSEGWGVTLDISHSNQGQGQNFYENAPIKTIEDVENLATPRHRINEEKTTEQNALVSEALNGNLHLYSNRSPFWLGWEGDISTKFAQLRGLEQMMMDTYTEPELLHALLSHMRDGILKAQDEAEKAGDFTMADSANQSVAYAASLPNPDCTVKGVSRKQLWCHMPAQEFALIGPDQHEEFMFNYQMPIMEKFGLVAYGCCEDLSRKIPMIRRMPNIRRVAVTPWADIARCAEGLGTDYVLSYRPNPAEMGAVGFDEKKIKSILHRDMSIMKANNCRFDITLKDMQTIENDPTRLKRWVELTREVVGDLYGC